ncbi:MAG: hypothetical protein OES32_05225 [Acidobacteriota bacterium]|nr:hypothetical protein [Acidobacteriota bacterium]MDH3522970.1 hypothetical protein [Acidobacteriota bacterium]
MFPRQPTRPGGIGGGLTAPVPRDLWLLLGVVFVTFSLRFFASTAWLPAALQLTPAVWRSGFVWQLATYAFVGSGQSGFWLLVTLLILYMFAGDVRRRLGRRGFWRLLVSAVVVAGVVAALAQLALELASGSAPTAFTIMQGERTLVAILIAAFATLAGEAIIYLFFVLPIRASWFLGLEILFAFLAFLPTRDLAGMLGVWAAVGYTYLALSGGLRKGGLRELWLRVQERWFRYRLQQVKRKRGFEVLPGGKSGSGDKDRWIH